VPDYRGQFLRGVGGNSAAIGAKQTDATYVREGEATTTLFGVQETKVLNIANNYEEITPVYYVLTIAYGNNGGNSYIRYSSGSKVDLNFKINTPGVEETRPANVAVRYLIRALP
jgi:hypothetical protein